MIAAPGGLGPGGFPSSRSISMAYRKRTQAEQVIEPSSHPRWFLSQSDRRNRLDGPGFDAVVDALELHRALLALTLTLRTLPSVPAPPGAFTKRNDLADGFDG
jgi:hypothetical protein